MMEFCAAAIIALCLLPAFFLRLAPFRSLLSRAKRRRIWICQAVLLILLTLMLTGIIGQVGFTRRLRYIRFLYFAYMAISTLMNIFLTHGRYREHLFVFGTLMLSYYSLLFIPKYVLARVAVDAAAGFFLVLGLFFVLLLLICYPMLMLLRRTVEPFLYLDTGNYWNTTWSVPCLLFLSLYICFSTGEDPETLIQLIARVMPVLVVVFICMAIARNHQHISQKKVLEAQLYVQKQHYTDLLEQVEKARQQRHDLKHHMAAIHRYIDNQDLQGLSRYIGDYGRRNEEHVDMPHTGNHAVDAVLYHSMKRAEEMQVNLSYAGTLRSCAVSDIDLCALLGNALENALDACVYLETGRTIEVVFQSRELMTGIVVRNSFDGTLFQTGPYLLSRKRKGEKRGVGVSSMREICQRCGGSLEYTWDSDTFTVLMLLPGRKP